MPKPAKLTPIERVIEGRPPVDRRREYERRMRDDGFIRVSVWVPKHERALVLELREMLATGSESDIQSLKEFFTCDYEDMLNNPEGLDELDLAFARKRLADLVGTSGTSGASEAVADQDGSRS